MTHVSDEQMQEIAERGEQAPSDIHEHLIHCERCRRELSFYRRLVGALSTAGSETLSPAFAGHVMERIDRERSKPFDYLEWTLLFVILVVGAPVLLYYVDWSFLTDSLNQYTADWGEWRSSFRDILITLVDSKAYLLVMALLIMAGFDRVGKLLLRNR